MDTPTTLPPHHPDDLRDMRECILAVIEDQFGGYSREGLKWLDTDEGKNHRHILGLWDASEDADAFDELAKRNPERAAIELANVDMADAWDDMDPDEWQKARANYWYTFDLFDDVVELMEAELSK